MSTGYNQVLSHVPHRIPAKWVLHLYFHALLSKTFDGLLLPKKWWPNPLSMVFRILHTLSGLSFQAFLLPFLRYPVLLPQRLMKSSLHTWCFSMLECIQKYFLLCFEWFLFSFSSWQNSTYFSKAFETHIMSLPVKNFFLMVPIFRQKELLLLLTS